jgi:hypothetical protein
MLIFEFTKSKKTGIMMMYLMNQTPKVKIQKNYLRYYHILIFRNHFFNLTNLSNPNSISPISESLNQFQS